MVSPKSSDQHDDYNFTVVYTDQDNNAPQYINVTVNSTTFPMDKQDSGDNNYTDGVLYQYVTQQILVAKY